MSGGGFNPYHLSVGPSAVSSRGLASVFSWSDISCILMDSETALENAIDTTGLASVDCTFKTQGG